jgi:hypothetical protein
MNCGLCEPYLLLLVATIENNVTLDYQHKLNLIGNREAITHNT